MSLLSPLIIGSKLTFAGSCDRRLPYSAMFIVTSTSRYTHDPASTMQKTGWTIHSFFLVLSGLKKSFTLDMITRGQSTTIFLCIGPFSAWRQTNEQPGDPSASLPLTSVRRQSFAISLFGLCSSLQCFRKSFIGHSSTFSKFQERPAHSQRSCLVGRGIVKCWRFLCKESPS